jgi:ATP-dependent DNA helicase PIF1
VHRARQQNNDECMPLSNDIINKGLIQIEDKIYLLSEKSLRDFGLPSPQRINEIDSVRTTLVHDCNQLNEYVSNHLPNLVPDQRLAFDVIVNSVENNEGQLLFIDAPGGTGKTYLMNLILAKIRSTGRQALAVASSGIAATLLSGGKTAHSTFKLPLNVSLQNETICSIRKNGPLGQLLQKVCLIIWDECTMSHRSHIEAVDRTLKDLRNSDKIMGGVTFVFAGDFRQTLPVVPRGTRADILKACLKSSPLWSSVQSITLRTNMRAHLGGGDRHFSSLLLQVGDGKIPEQDGLIKIDELGMSVSNLNDLISNVYPEIENICQKDHTWMCERAILSPRNSSVDHINEQILERIPGDKKIYKSIDTVLDTEDVVHYPQEFLNSLNPSGLPSHTLNIKVGIPIILLRNLNPPNLCNGTRLQVKSLRKNVIECIILTGPAAGQLAHIPRIPMIPTDLPFQFKRLQFPIKISFAITINKSQGQTYKYIGLDLREDCFTHGQLYVGLSRSGNAENQFILKPQKNETKNVVYHEVLK